MLAPNRYRRNLMLLLIALLAVRLLVLFVAPWGLYGDEAQYWSWSRRPDFGYFSKPPMIAWIIGATTTVFGNAEWAVRLAGSFLHTGTAALIFLAGRRAFDARIGAWAGAVYALMPGVWLSSYIISTDAALLFFWALALHAWMGLRDGDGWGRAVQLGLALGLGLMSKYAMVFLGPVIVLAVLFDAPTRRALLGPKGIFAGLLAMACLAPNLVWNAQHDFATLSHTAANANMGRDLFHPVELLTFWIEQFFVFGPMPFVVLICAYVAVLRGQLSSPARWLMAASVLPLAMISAQALLSRANANWAVTCYGAGTILVALWAVQSPRRMIWLKWGLIVQTIISVTLAGLALSERWIDAVKLTNAVKQVRAWPETANAVQIRWSEGKYDYVATDSRITFDDLNFYMPDDIPLRMWALNAVPDHNADLTAPLPAGAQAVLLLSHFENYANYFREDFETLTPLPPIEISLGPDTVRTLYVYRATGYTPTTRMDRE